MGKSNAIDPRLYLTGSVAPLRILENTDFAERVGFRRDDELRELKDAVEKIRSVIGGGAIRA